MRTEAPDNELIGAIYRAAMAAGGWSAVLDRVKARFSAQAVLLARHNLDSGIGQLLYSVGLDPRYAKRGGEFMPLDPWVRDRRVYQPGQVVSDDDIGNADWMREKFYQRFLRPQQCLYRLSGVMDRVGSEIWMVSLFRRPGQAMFGAAERGILARLLPHFERSLELQWEFARERGRRRLVLDLLDQLPTPILVVDAEAQPVIVNAAAEAILALNDGLAISGNRLKALWHTENERLERLIGRSCGRRNGRAVPAGGHLTIARPSGLRSFLVIATPLPRKVTGATGREEGMTAIVVKDPEVENQTSPRGRRELAELYELTPAEGRLVGLILDGLSLFEAADRLGVTKNTARTHMKHIYAKTGARRQAELVRRLAHLTSALS